MDTQSVSNVDWSNWIRRIDQRFVKNISYIGISNLVYAVSQWGIIVLVTKLSNIENVARLSLGLAIVTPIMLFLGAGLRVFISIDVQKKYAFGDYLIIRMITSITGFIIILAFSFIAGYSRTTFIVILLIAIVKITEGIQEVCWGINQRVEIMDPVGISRLLRSGACLLAITLGLLLSHNLIISILWWISLWLLVLTCYDLPHAKAIEPLVLCPDLEKTRSIFKSISPLALIAGLVSLNDKATQYQIAGLLGESAVGYYSPLAYVIQGVSLAMISVAESAMPRMATYYHSDHKAYVRGTLLLSATGTLIGVIMLAVVGSFRQIILPFLYTKEFLAYQNVFLLLLISGIFNFTETGFGVAVTVAGRFYQQTPILILNLIIVLVTGWYLIPRYGLNGAACSVGIGTLSLLILFMLLWMKSTSKSRALGS